MSKTEIIFEKRRHLLTLLFVTVSRSLFPIQRHLSRGCIWFEIYNKRPTQSWKCFCNYFNVFFFVFYTFITYIKFSYALVTQWKKKKQQQWIIGSPAPINFPLKKFTSDAMCCEFIRANNSNISQSTFPSLFFFFF